MLISFHSDNRHFGKHLVLYIQILIQHLKLQDYQISIPFSIFCFGLCMRLSPYVGS